MVTTYCPLMVFIPTSYRDYPVITVTRVIRVIMVIRVIDILLSNGIVFPI